MAPASAPAPAAPADAPASGSSSQARIARTASRQRVGEVGFLTPRTGRSSELFSTRITGPWRDSLRREDLPYGEMLVRFAQALDVSADDLLGLAKANGHAGTLDRRFVDAYATWRTCRSGIKMRCCGR